MSKHVHKWRRITAAEAEDSILGWTCEKNGDKFCGDEEIGHGRDRKCFDCRCAAHGPKPRKPGKRRPCEPRAKVAARKRQALAILRKPYSRVLIPQADGGFTAKVLEFPGCFAEGETAGETFCNLESAAESWLSACLSQDIPIPAPVTSYRERKPFARWSASRFRLLYDGAPFTNGDAWQRSLAIVVAALNAARVVLPKKARRKP
jgi:predicted RNase H-like HicB family nuclease